MLARQIMPRRWPGGARDLPAVAAYSSIAGKMSQNSGQGPVETELQRLEIRVGELLSLVQQLNEENRALRHRQDHLAGERAALLQKNEQARAGVEAMIGRLRMLENGV
jgi:cell division protein ZapB